ncbi:L-histidine N(alpha)-methyltransferase [Flavobacterium reichenbachii]|uniref:Methyltransferase n=1 Tax=Flavobacterium reichenbachii TaxID=362418 RepID=A0A085ZEW4_9FLAO|nr:L-histidine N(alpha)-methyltransferase [Flavobacterium reichenbachii]KFF02978.1 methyltransferase [Flavobacterium reichenbachii]OXB16970.1 L-histidine N(alpha)-methyltransferase [Flavobacterium reichenbachii]
MKSQLNIETIYKNKEAEHSNDQFLNDVIDGLQQEPKHLQSKYFYDKRGDSLFQEIMAMPEYYLTRCEMDIFKNKTQELASILMENNTPFDLIELGAGDASKSLHLLQFLKKSNADFTYMPIDISGNILSVLDQKLKTNIPDLDITILEGDYFEMLKKASRLSSRRKAVLFLGSNIGNMEFEHASDFCVELRKNLNKGDIVLVGFDLKKDPKIILNAYNDPKGITAAFNLNLLERINRELQGNFDVKQFEHFQNYDPLSGACRSYLVSLENQKVTIDSQAIDFAKDEVVYMEVSQKFSTADMEELAVSSGFQTINTIQDSKEWFADTFWLAV